MNRSRHIPRLLKMVLLLFCLSLLSPGCSNKDPEPIKIGFLGGITGRFSVLGVDGRDGTLLAIEQANAAGGINGRRLELIIRDDRQDAEAVQNAFTALHDEQVVAVVGPFTSAMAVAVLPLINQYKLVTVGPTVSTNDLCDLDDYFLRVRPESKFLARNLAGIIYNERGIRKISVIYDLKNESHSKSWYKALQKNFEAFGGEIVKIQAFNSAERASYFQMAQELLKTPTEGIFILAGSVDTGLFSQQLKKLKYDKALFASEWSFTNDLLQMGGSAVEGMTIIHTFNPQDQTPAYLKFSADYQERFGRKPSFSAAHAYDSTKLILTGLATNPDPDSLKKSLLQIPEFQGLQNSFQLNRYGDAERDLFTTTVKNGTFVVIK